MLSYSYERTVEWSECDPAGIIFFPRYAEWMVNGVNHMLMSVGFDPTECLDDAQRGLPCVSYESAFKSPAQLHDRVTHTITVTRLGSSSITFDHTFRTGDRVLAEASDTRVFVLMAGKQTRSVPISDALRTVLTGAAPTADDAKSIER